MADKYEDEILEGEVSDDDDKEENKKEPEKYCTLCHRAESQVGKMIDLPNNIHICPDCMQRSFDSMNTQMQSGNFNYGDLFNMPNISMINLSDLMNQQIPERQKIKKKKKEEAETAKAKEDVKSRKMDDYDDEKSSDDEDDDEYEYVDEYPRFRPGRIILGIISLLAFGFCIYKGFVTGLSTSGANVTSAPGMNYVIVALCMLE